MTQIVFLLFVTSAIVFLIVVCLGVLIEHYTQKHNYLLFKLAGISGLATVTLFTIFMTLQN